jgi:hypothetical protein
MIDSFIFSVPGVQSAYVNPMPNARDVTFSTGAASLAFEFGHRQKVQRRRTVASSNPLRDDFFRQPALLQVQPFAPAAALWRPKMCAVLRRGSRRGVMMATPPGNRDRSTHPRKW